jgi:large subunit ribosomal protein L25
MSDEVILNAELRERVGKGAARATRREGKVPAVIYGGKQAPLSISLPLNEVTRQMHRPGFFSHLLTIKVGKDSHTVLARDLQLDPIKDTPTHIDLLRVAKDAEIHVDVPVVFINEEDSPGLKRGGVLNIVRHEVEVICKASAIPEQLEGNLAGLDIGDSLHISAFALPEGVRPAISDRDFTVATVAAPSAVKAEAAEQQAAEAEEAEAEELEGEEEEGEGEGEEEEGEEE